MIKIENISKLLNIFDYYYTHYLMYNEDNIYNKHAIVLNDNYKLLFNNTLFLIQDASTNLVELGIVFGNLNGDYIDKIAINFPEFIDCFVNFKKYNRIEYDSSTISTKEFIGWNEEDEFKFIMTNNTFMLEQYYFNELLSTKVSPYYEILNVYFFKRTKLDYILELLQINIIGNS